MTTVKTKRKPANVPLKRLRASQRELQSTKQRLMNKIRSLENQVKQLATQRKREKAKLAKRDQLIKAGIRKLEGQFIKTAKKQTTKRRAVRKTARRRRAA